MIPAIQNLTLPIADYCLCSNESMITTGACKAIMNNEIISATLVYTYMAGMLLIMGMVVLNLNVKKDLYIFIAIVLNLFAALAFTFLTII